MTMGQREPSEKQLSEERRRECLCCTYLKARLPPRLVVRVEVACLIGLRPRFWP